MVEERWLPLRTVVALGTASHFPCSELLRVYVLVTVLALRWSRLEVDVDDPGLKVWRSVTIDASGRPVRPKEDKFCFRVVESGEFLPRFSVVAGLASCRRPISPRLQHPLLKLSFVRIGVATGATEIVPVINGRGLRLELG